MTSDLVNAIRKRIVLLDYRPGEILVPSKIAAEFSVSVTPIREALIRLEAEGLVRRLPSRSIQVAEVSLLGIKGLFEVKLVLNDLSGRLAARRISQEEVAELKKLLSRLEKAGDRRELLEVDEAMHVVISNAARNPELARITLRQRYHIARLWYFVHEHTEYEDSLISDFRALVPALESRDEERAGQIMWRHLESFMPVIQKLLASQ